MITNDVGVKAIYYTKQETKSACFPIPSFCTSCSSCMDLTKWHWSWLNPIAWVQSFFETRTINSIIHKLNPSNKPIDRLLTPDESKKALELIASWLKAEKPEEQLSTKSQKLIQFLIDNRLLNEKEATKNKEKLVTTIESYIDYLKRNGKQFTNAEHDLLFKAVALEIFISRKNSEKIHYLSKQQIVALDHLRNEKSSKEQTIASFIELASILLDPVAAKKYFEVAVAKDRLPFFVDDQLICWMGLGEMQGIFSGSYYFYEKFSSLAKCIEKNGGVAGLQDQMKRKEVPMKIIWEFATLMHHWPFKGIQDSDFKDDNTKVLFSLFNNFTNFKELYKLNFGRDEEVDFLESRISELAALRKKIDHGSKPLSLSEVFLFLRIKLALTNFKKEFKVLGSLSSLIAELSEWNACFEKWGVEANLKQDEIKKIERMLEGEEPKVENIKKKIDAMVKAKKNQQLDTISYDEKLTLAELYFLDLVPCLFQDLGDRANGLKQTYTDFYQHLASHEKKDFMHVCLVKMPADHNVMPHNEEQTSLWDRVKAYAYEKLTLIAIYFLKKEGMHCNFLHYNKEQDQFITNGFAGDIHTKTISARYVPHIEEYEFDVERLMPQSVTEKKIAEFKTKFFANLKGMFVKQKRNLKLHLGDSVWDFFKKRLCFLGLNRTTPAEIEKNLDDTTVERNLICSQFACEAIISAQVKTCREVGVEPPDSLSFFGLYHRQKIGSVTPNRLRDAFVGAGIFKRVFSPYQ